VDGHGGDGVLLTGVYGSGKSSVAAVAGNYRPVGVVAREVLDFLGWDSGRG
jgi:predicted AAA+ superfamily ATPase